MENAVPGLVVRIVVESHGYNALISSISVTDGFVRFTLVPYL